MTQYLRILKEKLKKKEQELLILKKKAHRIEHEYRLVRHDFHMEWYGRDRKQKAQAKVRQMEHEIGCLKKEITKLEKYQISIDNEK